MSDGKATFLPCAYGYATTVRKAQGASLDGVALYFDHCYPPERGYGYVGASRARTKAGLYHYGRVRRSDWLPVGGDDAQEQTMRGVDSESDRDNSDDDFEEDESDDGDAFAGLYEGDQEEADEGESDGELFGGLARDAPEGAARDDAGLF